MIIHKSHNLYIIGHRGAAGLAFENTLASVQVALDLGVPCIEIDVWLTTDGELVVFHDASLERLTNTTGFIYEKDTVFLQTIPLKNGASIPFLREIIVLVKPSQTKLLVELKDEKALPGTLKLLRENLPESQFMIGSFSHAPIMKLKKENPQIQTAIMFEGVPANLGDYLDLVNPNLVVTSIETINEELVETVKKQHRKLVFYTVNSPAEFERAVRADPYGIVTNFPDRFL